MRPPTKLGAKLEPPYPDHYYEGPYELFLQTGGIFLMPGYSGRRLWVDGAQIWEPAPRQVAMMIMGDNTQPQLGGRAWDGAANQCMVSQVWTVAP